MTINIFVVAVVVFLYRIYASNNNKKAPCKKSEMKITENNSGVTKQNFIIRTTGFLSSLARLLKSEKGVRSVYATIIIIFSKEHGLLMQEIICNIFSWVVDVAIDVV